MGSFFHEDIKVAGRNSKDEAATVTVATADHENYCIVYLPEDAVNSIKTFSKKHGYEFSADEAMKLRDVLNKIYPPEPEVIETEITKTEHLVIPHPVLVEFETDEMYIGNYSHIVEWLSYGIAYPDLTDNRVYNFFDIELNWVGSATVLEVNAVVDELKRNGINVRVINKGRDVNVQLNGRRIMTLIELPTPLD